ncbi:RNA polymerase sigma factor SigI [Nocardia sp. NPDC088792]|uniref:RNA polymerase sigma factor SigI n=1 Tax=Nocardia sp. NPDC088792 TaxID=3364332 RepID=UPI0037F98870
MSTDEHEPATSFDSSWRTNRPYVVDLAFRLLGDIGDAEDVAQEVFTRLARTRPGEIDDERAWLTVVTSRRCLDHLRSARARRERPNDPIELISAVPLTGSAPIDPADRITLDEEVQLALYRLLERLAPAERIALVLHDVFAVPFDVVADTLGRPVGSCRQLARRARQKMSEAHRAEGVVLPDEHRAVTERFMAACALGDLEGLLAVLDPDVWGVATFPPGSAIDAVPSRGAEMVAANMSRFAAPAVTMVTHAALGRPAVLLYRDRVLFAVFVLTIAGDRIVKIEASIDL